MDRPTSAGLGRLLDRLSSALQGAGVADGPRRTLLVIVDELVSNTLNYRAPGGRPHIQVRVGSLSDGGLEVELEDDGTAFDPLDVEPPALDGPLELRPVGGLGVWIVRKLARDLRYAREGEWNRLWLRIPPSG